MPMLSKQIALVTGGSRGIGRAICLELAKNGYYVIINFRSNKKAAEDTLGLIHQAGGKGETSVSTWPIKKKPRKHRGPSDTP